MTQSGVECSSAVETPPVKVIITAVIKHSLGASGESLTQSINIQQKKAAVHSAIFKVSQQLRPSWMIFNFFKFFIFCLSPFLFVLG